MRSQSGDPATCVIDCQGTESEPHRGFLFVNGEGPDSRLEGVTVTNGVSGDAGGAIYCNASSPSIVGCVFTGNRGHDGGAVWCIWSAAPEIASCRFTGNVAHDYGGAGIRPLGDAAPLIEDCIINDTNRLIIVSTLGCISG